MSEGPNVQRYVPPKIETIEQLKRHVDDAREKQNGHGWHDVERWFTRPDEFGRKPGFTDIAKKINRDRKTVRSWYEIFKRGK